MGDPNYAANRRTAIINLRAVSALAAKLADDVEGGKLWEGDFSQTMAMIQRTLRDVPDIR